MTCIEYNNFKLFNENCIDVMQQMSDNGIGVDVTITSPPYDSLRTYNNSSIWNFEVFKKVAEGLWDVTNDGGVVVWVVGDACINGSKTGTSYRQCLYFMDLGFKFSDNIIFEKNSSSFPARRDGKRYTQIYENMFVFSKGKIHDCHLIADKPNKYAGFTSWSEQVIYDKDGNKIRTSKTKPVPEFSLRNNIWKYTVGFNTKKFGNHPAVFPLQLAIDHILSWSLPEHVIFDPFLGSGTTMDACIKTDRSNFIGCEIDKEYFEIIKNKVEYYGNGNSL